MDNDVVEEARERDERDEVSESPSAIRDKAAPTPVAECDERDVSDIVMVQS